MLRSGDEGLLAVDDIAIALQARSGPHALQIRTGTGLRHGDGADQFASRHAGQPAALLFLGAVVQDVMSDNAAADGDGAKSLRRDIGHVLEHSGVVGESRTEPAKGFRYARQQGAHLTERPPCGAIHRFLLAPRLGVRLQFLGEKFPELVAKDI
jgi:hypothetical protein